MNTGRSSWRHRAVHTVHRIPKAQFKVANWAEYEAGLRRRGSLTLWITEEAIDAWGAAPRATPDGHATFSESAIQTCLMLRMAFKLPLRPAEGLTSSVVELLGCELAVPDHTTVSRRATKLPSIARAALSEGPLHVGMDSTGLKIYGAGEWLTDKLCLDATEDISRFAHIGTVIIIGGDSDFMPVAQKIKAAGRTLIGIGTRKNTNKHWAKSCHEFRYYDSLVETPSTEEAPKPSEAKDTPAPPPADPAAELLKRAVRLLAETKGQAWVNKGSVWHMIKRLDATFDAKDHGHANTSPRWSRPWSRSSRSKRPRRTIYCACAERPVDGPTAWPARPRRRSRSGDEPGQSGCHRAVGAEGLQFPLAIGYNSPKMGAVGRHADHRQERAETVLAAARMCRCARAA